MEMHEFILSLLIILVSARIFAEIFSYLKIPPVLGEVFAGILIGPSILGIVEVNEIIKIIAEIGIILLLFEVGLETDLKKLQKEGTKSVIVALFGAIVPFGLGFAVSFYMFNLPLIVSLFIGGTLTATSIGITVRVLKDLGKERTSLAQIVVGAAVLDDVIGVILLVILADFALTGEVNIENTIRIIILVALFFATAPVLAAIMSKFIHVYDRRYRRVPGFIPTIIISLILFFAYVAHLFGAPEIIGAFAAGIALSRRFFLPFGIALKADPHFVEKLETQMRPLIFLFTPVFFVTVGLSMNLREIDFSSLTFWLLTSVLIIVAVFGKVGGAYLLKNMNGLKKLILGTSMVPRGEVGLIFAELGRSAKIFTNEIYSAVVFVVIITTLLPPFLLKYLFRLEENREKEEKS
ncbi:cation:proton antiporter [Persephonella atlantica]|uniref:Cation:proton antiporter n=2 Tax=Persephonella atlantica TaxID=2699429 RepID=A0ABS1GKF0_9AQUI|nr:cation:proton antiporter [Persephonella atlantica]MBK3333315.1 cation:proton antiporter [Persephonella atlantica]